MPKKKLKRIEGKVERSGILTKRAIHFHKEFNIDISSLLHNSSDRIHSLMPSYG